MPYACFAFNVFFASITRSYICLLQCCLDKVPLWRRSFQLWRQTGLGVTWTIALPHQLVWCPSTPRWQVLSKHRTFTVFAANRRLTRFAWSRTTNLWRYQADFVYVAGDMQDAGHKNSAAVNIHGIMTLYGHNFAIYSFHTATRIASLPGLFWDWSSCGFTSLLSSIVVLIHGGKLA